MEEKSLCQLITRFLKDAKVEHTVAVLNQKATDEDWPEWYGAYVSQRLVPFLTGLQSVTVDGNALPPFYTRSAQQEIGSAIASRFHVGE